MRPLFGGATFGEGTGATHAGQLGVRLAVQLRLVGESGVYTRILSSPLRPEMEIVEALLELGRPTCTPPSKGCESASDKAARSTHLIRVGGRKDRCV